MRVLVTGGCGFLGRAFVHAARAAGHAVCTLDVTPGADRVVDLADADAVAAALHAVAPDVVVHLAARLTDTSERDPLAAVRVNALGTAALFVAAEAAGAARVVHASSNAAVGRASPGAGDDVALEPRSVYGVTKAFGEHLGRALSGRVGSPAHLALRFGWVYGPGRARGWADPQRVIAAVLAGERRVRWPDYGAPIDWTYVDDAVLILLRALDCPLERYAAHNALGDHRTMRAAIDHLRLRFPDLVAEPVAATRPDSAWDLADDRLADRIGPWPRTTLEAGIDRMIAAADARQPEPLEHR